MPISANLSHCTASASTALLFLLFGRRRRPRLRLPLLRRRRRWPLLVPLIELLFLLPFLLRAPLLHWRRWPHQRMSFLWRWPLLLLLLTEVPVGWLHAVLRSLRAILVRLRIPILRLSVALLLIGSRLALRHRACLVVVPAVRLGERAESRLDRPPFALILIHLRRTRWSCRMDQRLLIQTPARLSLPLLNRTRRRRRSSHRNHHAADYCSRRPRRSWPARTQHTRANRFRSYHTAHWSRSNFPGIDPHYVLRHGTRIHKRLMRDHRHAIGDMLVHVRDVVDRRVAIHDHCVIDVRDSRDIHRGVGDVHVVHVRAADMVSRNINFSRSQREPSHADAC